MPTFAAWLGKRVLPFTNARVVAPPGAPSVHGRPNIVVATPMRCGTHVLIDLLLNNLPAYRNEPLYVDLDKSRRLVWKHPDLLSRVDSRAGYVLKTHLPAGLSKAAQSDPDLLRLIESGPVVTVMRPKADVIASLERWRGARTDHDRIGDEWDAFWDFWRDRPRIELQFSDLFDAARMRALLAEIADRCGVEPARTFTGPPPRHRRTRIQLARAMTRVAGRRAWRVDTTIHTLKG